MPFSIQIVPSALAELKAIAVFHRRRIAEAIEHQLAGQPLVQHKNRKLLRDAAPSFDCEPPIWELRVGEHRVYYDVDEKANTVFVRAVRIKPPHLTTDTTL